jgi:hypothetical protein
MARTHRPQPNPYRNPQFRAVTEEHRSHSHNPHTLTALTLLDDLRLERPIAIAGTSISSSPHTGQHRLRGLVVAEMSGHLRLE